MANGRITVAPDVAREKMVLSLVIDGIAPATVILEAPKAAELARKIGRANAAIHDRQVSQDSPMTVLEFASINPGWRASADVSLAGERADSIALALHHNTYGWLTFILPDEEARTLGQWLLDRTKGN